MFSKILTVAIIAIGLLHGLQSRRIKRGIGAAFDPDFPPEGQFMEGDSINGREYPSMVSLRLDGDHICGGTILNSDWILTAAHCCSSMTPWNSLVVSGSNFLSKGGTFHRVQEIIQHENYDPTDSWLNDICVIKVTSPIMMGNGTAPVVLERRRRRHYAEGAKATVVGWGQVTMWGDTPDDIRKTILPMVDRDTCKLDIIGFDIFDSQVCAGDGAINSHSGDSGGPLFLNNKEVGIVSWGRRFPEKGFPSVFTKVSKYIKWIKRNTR